MHYIGKAILEFFTQVSNSPKKAAEAGGSGGALLGLGRWLIKYYDHLIGDLMSEILDGIIVTSCTTFAGVTVAFFVQKLWQRFFKK